MRLKTNMTPIGEQSFAQNIKYLEECWSEKEVLQFIQIVIEHIEILQSNPELFPVWNNSIFRKAKIHKRINMFYSFDNRNLIIHLFWSTWDDPTKLNHLLKPT